MLASQQQQAFHALAQAEASRDTRLAEALWLTDYTVAPPTIEEFVTDSFFLGVSLRPTSGTEGFWQAWQAWLTQNFDLDYFLHNVVITGAIGTGKTLVLVILFLYRICQCLLLRDPYAFYGLGRDTGIHFILLSISQKTLQATVWPEALQLLGLAQHGHGHAKVTRGTVILVDAMHSVIYQGLNLSWLVRSNPVLNCRVPEIPFATLVVGLMVPLSGFAQDALQSAVVGDQAYRARNDPTAQAK